MIILEKHKPLYKTYNISFGSDGNEAQFDVRYISELNDLWSDFCKENNLDPNSVNYIEFVGYTDVSNSENCINKR